MYSNFFKRYYIKDFAEFLVQQWNIKDTLKVVFFRSNMYYIQYSLIGQVIQMLMTRHFIMTETKSIINDKNSKMNSLWSDFNLEIATDTLIYNTLY